MDADDITQDVFYKYLESKEIFNTDDNEKYWLIRVTINACKSYNKNSWKTKVDFDDDKINIMPDSVNSERIKEVNELYLLVLNLPFKYKDIIILYYYEDFTIEEISQSLNISISATKKRLERARKMLKEKIKEY